MAPAPVDRVRLLIGEVLDGEVPSDTTDLIDSGLIDSLTLATIIVTIEEEFQVELLDDLDVDQFRSVARIEKLLSTLILAET
jgi:acyl carrier protein